MLYLICFHTCIIIFLIIFTILLRRKVKKLEKTINTIIMDLKIHTDLTAKFMNNILNTLTIIGNRVNNKNKSRYENILKNKIISMYTNGSSIPYIVKRLKIKEELVLKTLNIK